MFKKILLVLVGAIVILLIAASTQPDTFEVAREQHIMAAPEVVFDQVNNLHNWHAWSPWEKLDPNMKKTFEGPEAGEGAVYGWDGNDDVGAGKMTIIESVPNEKVDLKLQFLRPFESESDTKVTFAKHGDGTHVRWAMSGDNNFMGKIMCLFMDMDAMIGKDFEQGLSSLKEVSESQPAPAEPEPAPAIAGPDAGVDAAME